MKQMITALLCVFLASCGTVSTFRGEQQTDYVLASRTQASGVWKLIRGGAVACKISTHGTNPGYTIEFDGDTCRVSAAK